MREDDGDIKRLPDPNLRSEETMLCAAKRRVEVVDVSREPRASGLLMGDDRIGMDPTTVECPTCGARVGWACEGANYGYHAAGYHRSRQRAADQAASTKVRARHAKVST